MDATRPLLTAEAARADARSALDVIDAALDQLRATSTDLVGNGFRSEMAERLEYQCRVNRGLSYRILDEIVDPPDGPEGPASPAVRVRLSASQAAARHTGRDSAPGQARGAHPGPADADRRVVGPRVAFLGRSCRGR